MSASEEEWRSEVEALREVLNALTDFLKELGPLLSKLVKDIMDSMNGERVGENVAAFYRKLRESGMPEEMIAELTRKYCENLLVAGKLLEKVAKGLGGGWREHSKHFSWSSEEQESWRTSRSGSGESKSS